MAHSRKLVMRYYKACVKSNEVISVVLLVIFREYHRFENAVYSNLRLIFYIEKALPMYIFAQTLESHAIQEMISLEHG